MYLRVSKFFFFFFGGWGKELMGGIGWPKEKNKLLTFFFSKLLSTILSTTILWSQHYPVTSAFQQVKRI